MRLSSLISTLVLALAISACGGSDDGPTTSGSTGGTTGPAPAAADDRPAEVGIAEAFLRANRTLLDVVGEPAVVTMTARPSREAMEDLYRRSGIPEDAVASEVEKMLARPWLPYQVTGPRTAGKYVTGNVTVVDGRVTAASMEVVDPAARTGETWDLVAGKIAD